MLQKLPKIQKTKQMSIKMFKKKDQYMSKLEFQGIWKDQWPRSVCVSRQFERSVPVLPVNLTVANVHKEKQWQAWQDLLNSDDDDVLVFYVPFNMQN